MKSLLAFAVVIIVGCLCTLPYAKFMEWRRLRHAVFKHMDIGWYVYVGAGLDVDDIASHLACFVPDLEGESWIAMIPHVRAWLRRNKL